ncbi:MAG: hypothetical protein ACJAVV_001580 [Alphaproteobacteria bacterium]|jgi:hypothetical protein
MFVKSTSIEQIYIVGSGTAQAMLLFKMSEIAINFIWHKL